MEMLMDPNVWVADTGASCDSTSHVSGLENCRIAPSNDGITLPDGSKKAATMIADLTSMVCNKTGNQLFTTKMSNIKYCKGQQFNLFSLTKRLKQGWQLHGDNDSIWIKKGNDCVQFDVRIGTKE
eukprot:4186527-Ditylum_brightwellii.AAC.1